MSSDGGRVSQSFVDIVSSSAFVVWLSSSYALMAIFMAVVLNRTVVFASVRRPARLTFGMRLALRCLPILLLGMSGFELVQILAYRSGWSSWILRRTSTSSVLWKTFASICFAKFIDVLSAVLEMRMPPEDGFGLSIIEYSLAFSEAARYETSSEVLTLTLLSAASILNAQMLCLFNLRRYKLWSSSLWGIVSLVFFSWAILTGRYLQLPSVCWFTYVPHLVVVLVISTCCAINILASFFVSSPSDLRTNIMNSAVLPQPQRPDDFFSVILDWGIVALGNVSEGAFFNETFGVPVPQHSFIDRMPTSVARRSSAKTTSGFLHLAEPASLYTQDIYAKSKAGSLKRSAKIRLGWQLIFSSVKLYLYWGKRMLLRSLPDRKFSKSPVHEYDELESEVDDDFIPLDDSDDSDADSENSNQYSVSTADDNESKEEEAPLQELFPDITSSLGALLSPKNPEEAEYAEVLKVHLESSKPLTRIGYNTALQQANEQAREETQLRSVALDRRRSAMSNQLDCSPEATCVVCQSEPRTIVLWPCRCLCCCDGCRTILGSRGYKTCPCCRR